jgi:hypothetical protein
VIGSNDPILRTEKPSNVTSLSEVFQISLEGSNAKLQKPFFVMSERVGATNYVISAVTLEGASAGWLALLASLFHGNK